MDKGYYGITELSKANYVNRVAIHNKNGQGLLQLHDYVCEKYE